MDNKKIFQERLKTARETKRLSQADLAERCGLAPTAISHFECGMRSPSLKNLIKLGLGLDVSIDWLVGRKSEEIISGRVYAYVDDWPKIRKFERELLKN